MNGQPKNPAKTSVTKPPVARGRGRGSGGTSERRGGSRRMLLRKGTRGSDRHYIGRFLGSQQPQVNRHARLTALREFALATKLQRVAEDESIKNKTQREEELKRVKFSDKEERDFWFEFLEVRERAVEDGEKDGKGGIKKTTRIGKNGQTQRAVERVSRSFLGRPSLGQEKGRYALIEFDMENCAGTVYPVEWIEFDQERHVVSDKNLEELEKMHRKRYRQFQSKIAESGTETMRKLFGMQDKEDGKGRGRKGKKKGEDDQTAIPLELRACLDGGLVGSATTDNEIVADKARSGRLKRQRARGQMDELPDYDEEFSDDEDEGNLGDWDRVDDRESDHYDSDDGDESSEGELFGKLKNLQTKDVENIDYPIEVKDEEKSGPREDETDSQGDWIGEITDDEEEVTGEDGKKRVKRPSRKRPLQEMQEQAARDQMRKRRREAELKSGKLRDVERGIHHDLRRMLAGEKGKRGLTSAAIMTTMRNNYGHHFATKEEKNHITRLTAAYLKANARVKAVIENGKKVTMLFALTDEEKRRRKEKARKGSKKSGQKTQNKPAA